MAKVLWKRRSTERRDRTDQTEPGGPETEQDGLLPNLAIEPGDVQDHLESTFAMGRKEAGRCAQRVWRTLCARQGHVTARFVDGTEFYKVLSSSVDEGQGFQSFLEHLERQASQHPEDQWLAPRM